jgi:hypothetical protein
MMWVLDHMILVTILAAAALVGVAWAGFLLSVKKLPGHTVAGQVLTVTVSIGIAIFFSIALNHLWVAKRERDQRTWTARAQHLQRLQLLLRTESDSLNTLARALREGRYFTLVADDARKAIWQDDALTPDVEHHFPEYFREREQLIQRILDYDTEMGRIRQVVSASLQLSEATEAYRSDLLPALVDKCGGAGPGVSLTRTGDTYTISRMSPQSSDSVTPEQLIPIREAVRAYEEYKCSPELSNASQSLLDRAEDLADAASIASEAARRYAEETVLRGSCSYAPTE